MVRNRAAALISTAVIGTALIATALAGPAMSATKKTTTTRRPAATTAPTTKAASASPTTAAATASGGPKGTLRIAAFTDIPSMDPIRSQLTHAPYLATSYDTLLRRDADGNVIAGLATQWSRPDIRTWRFTLRSGVKFQDGANWDADAAKFNIDRARNLAANPNIGLYAGITAVNVVDPQTIEVRFSKGNPSFAFEMASVAASMVSPKGTDFTRNPIGTGGWVFDRGASQEGAKYVYNAFPDYWDKANQRYARIEISVVADNAARLNALRTGQVDVVDVVLSNQLDDARKANIKTISAPDQTIQMLVGDRRGEIVPALGKREVRQAMQYAINREAYVKAVQDGIGGAETSIWRTDSKWFVAGNANRYAYDRDKAKALLAKAGYPDGFEFSIPSFATTKAQNEAFATLMADVGIRVKIVQVAPGTAGIEFRRKTFPVVFAPTAVADPHSYWATWISPDSPWNPFGVENTVLDGLASRALDLPTDAGRKAVYDDLEQAIQDEGLILVLAHGVTITGMRGDAKGNPYLYSGERIVRPYLLDIPVS
jgi:peptide/nickel transport system substrate-binding protein